MFLTIRFWTSEDGSPAPEALRTMGIYFQVSLQKEIRFTPTREMAFQAGVEDGPTIVPYLDKRITVVCTETTELCFIEGAVSPGNSFNFEEIKAAFEDDGWIVIKHPPK